MRLVAGGSSLTLGTLYPAEVGGRRPYSLTLGTLYPDEVACSSCGIPVPQAVLSTRGHGKQLLPPSGVIR